MRWFVDECVDAGLVMHLRASGHNVVYAAEVAPAANDTAIVEMARAQDRLLLTEDKDFGDLVFRRGVGVPGTVLLRIDPALHALKMRRLEAAIARFGDRLFGRYTIIEEARFRSRPLRSYLAGATLAEIGEGLSARNYVLGKPGLAANDVFLP